MTATRLHWIDANGKAHSLTRGALIHNNAAMRTAAELLQYVSGFAAWIEYESEVTH
jgi:hypothetical protein